MRKMRTWMSDMDFYIPDGSKKKAIDPDVQFERNLYEKMRKINFRKDKLFELLQHDQRYQNGRKNIQEFESNTANKNLLPSEGVFFKRGEHVNRGNKGAPA